jgi:hypothetical protein
MLLHEIILISTKGVYTERRIVVCKTVFDFVNNFKLERALNQPKTAYMALKT